MILKHIKHPWIAKEKFDYVANIKEKILHEKFADFVGMNLDYYTWLEETKEGKTRLMNIEKVPVDFRASVLQAHNRTNACAQFNEQKQYYEVIVAFNHDMGVISTTFQTPITKAHLRRLLDMANYVDAYLLNNGDEIIDEAFLEQLG